MRLAESIELFDRRTYDQSFDNVDAVWSDVSSYRACYTLVLCDDLTSYEQAVIAQRFRRIFAQDPVDIKYAAHRAFRQRYTAHCVFQS